MNLISAFEELNKLYESAEEPKKEEAEQEAVAEADKLTESVEDDEIEIVDEEAEEATEETSEESSEEEPVEDEPKLVLGCNNCGAVTINAESGISIDESTGIANAGAVCQYCEAAEGYKIIGTLVPYETSGSEEADEANEAEEAADTITAEEDVIEEGLLDVDVPINVDVQANGNSVPFMNTGL